ncbi:MAG: hypothetical protein LQ341_005695, partial [Variospora aurantia]
WYIVSTPIPILNPQQPRDKRPATTKSHRSFPESGAVKFVIAIRVRLSSVFIEVGVVAYYPSRVQHISATVTTYNISSYQLWSGVIFGRIGASQIYPWEYWSVPTYGGRMRDCKQDARLVYRQVLQQKLDILSRRLDRSLRGRLQCRVVQSWFRRLRVNGPNGANLSIQPLAKLLSVSRDTDHEVSQNLLR